MVLLVNVLQAESDNTLDPWSTPQCWGGKVRQLQIVLTGRRESEEYVEKTNMIEQRKFVSGGIGLSPSHGE
jgi:hypothetical protein